MTQTALTQYDELVELPVPRPQEVGRCELCNRLSSMYPVIYNGRRMNIHWECKYRIQEGLPMLERVDE